MRAIIPRCGARIAALVLVGVAMLCSGMASRAPIALAVGEIGSPTSPAGQYSWKGSDCNNERGLSDPVGVVFRGKHAGAAHVAELISFFTEALDPGNAWDETENDDKQGMMLRQDDGGYLCEEDDEARAEATQYWFNSRYHVRLWFVKSTLNNEDGVVKTVGTPHHEDFIPLNARNACEGATSLGDHAIDQNGPEGSGFDQGRRKLAQSFRITTHKVKREFWGNTERFKQCDGGVASSEGWGVVIFMPHGTAATASKAVAQKGASPPGSDAMFHGSVLSEEPVEWWFGYGRQSSSTGEYRHKTVVGSLTGTGQEPVSQEIQGLSPAATYYARLFVRNGEGEVEESNEVEYSTPKPGPVAEYSFDEGNGTTAGDTSGNGHDGTVEAPASWTKGKYGGALHFGGNAGGCVTVPSSPALALGEEFTIEAWVKSLYLGNEPIIFKEDEGGGSAPGSYVLAIGLGEFGKAEARVDDGEGGWEVVASSKSVELGVWTHLAATYDGAHLRLYVDGELVATKALPGDDLTGEGPLRIGCAPPLGSTFYGSIDEVQLYERSLSAAEVDADMETPIQAPASGPAAAWSFDEVTTEGETQTVEDRSGHGHTATLDGATPASGRYGASLEFDGENDCVSIESDAELEPTEEFTLEAWVRPEGEGLHGVITQEDESAAEGEDPFAWSLLSGDEEYEGPRVWVRNPGGKRGYAGGPPIPKGAWSHLAVTDDGGHLRFYVDGELNDTEPTVPLTTGKGPLTIGCIALYGDHFKGRIDEVRVYDRALNGGEVAADMEAPIQTPRKEPVAEYSFDEVQTEGENQTVEDLSGDGHTASLHGATWTGHGRYGGALEFDAAKEQYVSIPADAGLDGSEELTVEAWLRPGESRYLGEIAMKEREGSGPGYSWTLDQHLSKPVGYFMQSEEGMVSGGEDSLPLHTWTHVAMTDDGANDRLYVDGQLVDTAPATPFDGHGPIKVGGNQLFGQWFDGRIDELRIYERALSPAEIAYDMEAPIQTPRQGPVAEYSFDEGEAAGTTIEDQAGENDGTIEGVTWIPHGHYGGAIEFDGEGMVTIPGAEALDLTEEFTLEAWIRPEAGCDFGQIFVKEDADEEHAAYVVSKHGSKLGAYLGVPGVEEESPEGRIEIGTWQHIAVTFDGGEVRLYVDGEEAGSVPVADILPTTGPLRLGGSQIGTHGGGFVGRIDEVQIYNRALTAGEVAADVEG
jgi:hypothetical protein